MRVCTRPAGIRPGSTWPARRSPSRLRLGWRGKPCPVRSQGHRLPEFRQSASLELPLRLTLVQQARIVRTMSGLARLLTSTGFALAAILPLTPRAGTQVEAGFAARVASLSEPAG